MRITFRRLLIFSFALVAFAVVFPEYANAIDEDEFPPLFETSQADEEEVNNIGKRIIDTIRNIGLIGSLVGLAIGGLMCLPFVGKKEMGHDVIKTSFWVLAFFAAFWLIVALIRSWITG